MAPSRPVESLLFSPSSSLLARVLLSLAAFSPSVLPSPFVGVLLARLLTDPVETNLHLEPTGGDSRASEREAHVAETACDLSAAMLVAIH